MQLFDCVWAACRQMREAAEKEQEALRQATKERLRHIRADAEAIDSDGEDEPWARKPIADRWALCCMDSLLAMVLTLTVPHYGLPANQQLQYYGKSYP